MRSRQYVNAERAKQSQCNRQLISREMCVADKPECELVKNKMAKFMSIWIINFYIFPFSHTQ